MTRVSLVMMPRRKHDDDGIYDALRSCIAA